MGVVDVPQIWERLLWRGCGRWPARTRYALTDVRLAVWRGDRLDELTLYDVGDIEERRSPLDVLLRTSTLVVHARDERRSPLVLRHIRDGHQIAGLLEVLAGEPAAPDIEVARLALGAVPRSGRRDLLSGLFGLIVALTAVGAALAWQRSTTHASVPTSPPDREVDNEAMMRFMETTVMPWARKTLAPIVGGPDRVTCETCHGPAGPDTSWHMPAVSALPEEVVRTRGWEHYSDAMDPQLRNAIYGYAAESGKQSKATYMREYVMPGMARLLDRPAYDFTRSYDFNRRQQAFGCYHCHKVR